MDRDRGYEENLIPIAYQTKKSSLNNWPNIAIGRETVGAYFDETPQNVAVRLGEAGCKKVDMDLDAEEVRLLAHILLPETARFGRESSRSAHWIYTSSTGERVTFKDPLAKASGEKEMLLELRADGCYTVFPGSVHPSGEAITWENDIPTLTIEPDELKQRAATLAALALLKRYWPALGGRHDATVAVAGLLARAGMTEDELAAVLLALNDGDNPSKHTKWARDSVKRIESGKPLQGIPSLAKIFPQEVVQCVRHWLGHGIDPVILEMNDEFAVAWNNGSAIIIREYYDAVKGTDEVVFVEEAAVKLMLRNRPAPSSGGRKGEYLFDYWIRHPHRRDFEGVCFEPERDVPGYYNLWRGFAVKPDASKSCELYLQHLLHIICGGVNKLYLWILCWMAHAVQHPGEKPGSCIVLRGPEGAGKGLFVQYFAKLYGSHFVHLLQAEHLIGRFNGHLKSAAFVFVDEAFFAGDKSHDSVLKGLITEQTIQIEQKFKDTIAVRNSMRVIMATNNDWAAPAGIDARRYCILEVSGEKASNAAYFDALTKEMEDGGPEALMAFLLGYQLPQEFNPRNPPTTEVLFEQKLRTMPTIYGFLYECLQRGKLLAWDTDQKDYEWVMPSDEGRRWVPVRVFYDEYISEAHKVNERYREASEIVGKALKKIFGDCLVTKRKSMSVAARTDPDEEPEYQQVRCYGFSSLQKCREAWERAVKQSIDWEPLPRSPYELPESTQDEEDAMDAYIEKAAQRFKKEGKG